MLLHDQRKQRKNGCGIAFSLKRKKNRNTQNALCHTGPINTPADGWRIASWALLGCWLWVSHLRVIQEQITKLPAKTNQQSVCQTDEPTESEGKTQTWIHRQWFTNESLVYTEKGRGNRQRQEMKSDTFETQTMTQSLFRNKKVNKWSAGNKQQIKN